MDDMMTSGGNGNSKVTFTSSASGRSPTEGLSQQIVDNGKLSPDGKTFTYSWTGNGDEFGFHIPTLQKNLFTDYNKMKTILSKSTWMKF